jgi:tetratricopeptide (TPR) repeat protein
MLRIVAIYEKAGNYQKVVEFYKLAVEEKPDVAQLHASLATGYAMIGDYNNARIEALKAAELDPQFKAEADKFINSLPK